MVPPFNFTISRRFGNVGFVKDASGYCYKLEYLIHLLHKKRKVEHCRVLLAKKNVDTKIKYKAKGKAV